MLTWLIWLAAGSPLLLYCVLRVEAMLSAVQAVNIPAVVTTLILVRRSNRVCPHHAEPVEAALRRWGGDARRSQILRPSEELQANHPRTKFQNVSSG